MWLWPPTIASMPGDLLREVDVGGRAEVAEDDDALDPLGLERRDLVGDEGRGIEELHRRPGVEISAVSGVTTPTMPTFSPP